MVTVQRFAEDDEAIAWANDVNYGLAIGLDADVGRALNAARKLEFGTVWINDHIPLVSEMPHGGFKQSGYGKDLSLYALEDYTQIKHVMAKLTEGTITREAGLSPQELQRAARDHLWLHFTRMGGYKEDELPIIVRAVTGATSRTPAGSATSTRSPVSSPSRSAMGTARRWGRRRPRMPPFYTNWSYAPPRHRSPPRSRRSPRAT